MLSAYLKRALYLSVFTLAFLGGDVRGVLADGLAGDCCSDLEERVAELEATTARAGNRKVSLQVYGEINMALLYSYDPVGHGRVYIVSNDTTHNRLGFVGEAHVDSHLSAGMRIELEFDGHGSASVFQPQVVNTPATPDQQVRYANYWLENDRLGRATVGFASQATDGIAEIDFSGSTATSLSSVETWNEVFRIGARVNGDGRFFTPDLNSNAYAELFQGNFDGGRTDLMRYDLPTLKGFILSASWDGQINWDTALRYAHQFDCVLFGGGIGYRSGTVVDTPGVVRLLLSTLGRGGTEQVNNNIVGSFSLLHDPSGLFLVVAGGHREWDRPNQDLFPNVTFSPSHYIYVKPGVLANIIPAGKTSIYGEFYRIDGVGYNCDDACPIFIRESGGGVVTRTVREAHERTGGTVLGAGIVQHIDQAAAQIYLAYRHYGTDTITDQFNFTHDDVFGEPQGPVTVTSSTGMDMVMAGMRIEF